jgi:hypothetical protein
MSEQDAPFELKIERRQRVVFDHYVELAGVRFDADDLLATLHEVTGGNVTTSFAPAQTDVLKRLDILETEGSPRWCSPARLGPRGEDFIDSLGRRIEELDAEDKLRALVAATSDIR